MATKFIDRNKKKSLLGLLLLSIKENRVLSALLLLVALASFLFIAPSAMLLNLPGGTRLVAGIAWAAAHVGVDTSKWGFFAGGKRSYADFIAALNASKASGSRPAGWSAFFGKADPAAGGPGSLGLVQGRKGDLEGGGYADGKLPNPKEVAGVLTPEDAGNSEDGVAVDEALLAQQRGGAVREANAGGFTNPRGFAGNGAFANAGTFSGSAGAGGRSGDNIKNAMSMTDAGPVPHPKITGATKGKLSEARAAVMSKNLQRGISTSRVSGKKRAISQLADGRARAALATACTPPNCPGEFSAYNTGAVYDGMRVNAAAPDIINVPEIDGGSPQIPSAPDADVSQQIRDAEDMQRDADECRRLDDEYTERENELSANLDRQSEIFKSMDCGGGGCSKSKANRCKAQGNRIKQACADYAKVRNEHTNRCPLTRGKGAEINCSNSGMNSGSGVTSQSSEMSTTEEGVHTSTNTVKFRSRVVR